MKAAKTWCLASVVLLAGISSASCGKDEGTGGGPGTVLGGSGGSGGSSAGNPGRAGGGGSSGDTASATKLGQACVNDSQCNDPSAPGLTCVTAKDTVLDGAAPPKGLCTAECSSDDDCAPLGAGSICYPFDSNATSGYCVEGCSFGDPEPNAPAKCHNRPEFACNPALLGQTNSACSNTTDCQDGELCIDGTCAVVMPACLPACRGDLDCDPGLFCDQSFLNGVCVTKKPTGKALGEPCTVPADNEPAEPDECLGFCQADDTGSSKGHCAATCGIGAQCGWNPDTQKYDGACFYASVLTAQVGGIGDFGFCTPTCNCSDDCNDPGLECSLLSDRPLSSDFKGAGLCFSKDPTATEYNQCTDTGAGGGGGGGSDGGAGAPSGGAGEGGGGAAPVEGGAGGVPG